MRKWLLLLIAILLLSGCSFRQVWKWWDNLEWERDDQTIRIVDLFIK